MKGGRHGQSNLDILDAYGIQYNIEKIYSNGVRVGVIKTNGQIGTVFPDATRQP